MGRALTVCLLSYPALVDQLTDASVHNNAKATGLLRFLTSYEIVAFILLLKDVLAPLSTLSLWLQKPEATLSDVYLIVETTKDRLLLLKESNGHELQTLLDMAAGDAMFHG